MKVCKPENLWGPMRVRLSKDLENDAVTLGGLRQLAGESRAYKSKSNNQSVDIHVMGARGEIAVAVALGLDLPDLTNDLGRLWRLSGGAKEDLAFGIEVRTMKHPEHYSGKTFTPDVWLYNRDRKSHILVAAYTRRSGVVEIVGWHQMEYVFNHCIKSPPGRIGDFRFLISDLKPMCLLVDEIRPLGESLEWVDMAKTKRFELLGVEYEQANV